MRARGFNTNPPSSITIVQSLLTSHQSSIIDFQHQSTNQIKPYLLPPATHNLRTGASKRVSDNSAIIHRQPSINSSISRTSSHQSISHQSIVLAYITKRRQPHRKNTRLFSGHLSVKGKETDKNEGQAWRGQAATCARHVCVQLKLAPFPAAAAAECLENWTGLLQSRAGGHAR